MDRGLTSAPGKLVAPSLTVESHVLESIESEDSVVLTVTPPADRDLTISNEGKPDHDLRDDDVDSLSSDDDDEVERPGLPARVTCIRFGGYDDEPRRPNRMHGFPVGECSPASFSHTGSSSFADNESSYPDDASIMSPDPETVSTMPETGHDDDKSPTSIKRPSQVDKENQENEVKRHSITSTTSSKRKVLVCKKPRSTVVSGNAERPDGEPVVYSMKVKSTVAEQKASAIVKKIPLTAEDLARATTVTFDRSQGHLGLYVAHGSYSLIVWEVVPKGILANWNKQNRGKDSVIRVGDQILSVAVDGEIPDDTIQKPRMMSALLQSSKSACMEFTVLRRETRFEVKFSYQPSRPQLGLYLTLYDDDASDEKRVFIQSIKNGLVGQMNRRNAKTCICIGDEILSIDDVKGEKMLEVLTEWTRSPTKSMCVSILAHHAVVGGPKLTLLQSMKLMESSTNSRRMDSSPKSFRSQNSGVSVPTNNETPRILNRMRSKRSCGPESPQSRFTMQTQLSPKRSASTLSPKRSWRERFGFGTKSTMALDDDV